MTREEDLNPRIRTFFQKILKQIEHLERDLQDLESRLLKLEKDEDFPRPRNCQSTDSLS